MGAAAPLGSATKPGGAPAPEVRTAVRNLLLSSAAFHDLTHDEQRAVARSMVRVSDTALKLLAEEAESASLVEAARRRSAAMGTAAGAPATSATRLPLAVAAGAGQQFSGVATDKIASTTRQILNAVSFPRFVTDLINGVFKAITDSNHQQMQSFVELLNNVAATTDDFADANVGADRAREWLVQHYPGSFEIVRDDDSDPQSPARLQLKDGAAMPPEGGLKTELGMAPGDSIPSGEPETALVPIVRQLLARQRQQMLGTMVMLGLQRIVIDSGRLNASMHFHIDTSSGAKSDEGSRFDWENRFDTSGHVNVGVWGADAHMTNTIGYVSTERNQTTEEMNTDLDLSSSVELIFRTDYLPLERMAGPGQVDRIKVNTINPQAEADALTKARIQRADQARQDDQARLSALDRELAPSPLALPAAPASTPPASARAAPPASSPSSASAQQPPSRAASSGATIGSAQPNA
jgi:hypothetical protein